MVQMPLDPPEDRAQADRTCAEFAAALAAFALRVPLRDIAQPTRGHARAAFARQLGMYLACTGFGMSLQRAGNAFTRDRSTIAHACRKMEDRRDDPRFDAFLFELEQVIEQTPALARLAPLDRKAPGSAPQDRAAKEQMQ